MNIDLKRAAAVTGALAVTGFICGAATGTLVTAGMVWRTAGLHGPAFRGVVSLGVAYGGTIGAVLTPPLSWLLLRRVSLGRALLETAVGALAGAGIAIAFAPYYAIVAALGGFVLAALRLRVMRSAPQRVSAGDDASRFAR